MPYVREDICHQPPLNREAGLAGAAGVSQGPGTWLAPEKPEMEEGQWWDGEEASACKQDPGDVGFYSS